MRLDIAQPRLRQNLFTREFHFREVRANLISGKRGWTLFNLALRKSNLRANFISGKWGWTLPNLACSKLYLRTNLISGLWTKKVRQIATPNVKLRLSGAKYLLLSFCFVSSLHQTLPSHFEVWYSFAKKWFRPNWGFPHKSSWCAQSYFAHTGRFMKGWVLPSFLCQEQKCAKKKSCSPEKLVKLPSCQFSHEKLVRSPSCQFRDRS